MACTDGDLDLMTSSYNLELQDLLEETFEGQTASGLHWHEQRASRFHRPWLVLRSQALALAVMPGKDGVRLLAGNDFLLLDGNMSMARGRMAHQPSLCYTTQNTMSFSAGMSTTMAGWISTQSTA